MSSPPPVLWSLHMPGGTALGEAKPRLRILSGAAANTADIQSREGDASSCAK